LKPVLAATLLQALLGHFHVPVLTHKPLFQYQALASTALNAIAVQLTANHATAVSQQVQLLFNFNPNVVQAQANLRTVHVIQSLPISATMATMGNEQWKWKRKQW